MAVINLALSIEAPVSAASCKGPGLRQAHGTTCGGGRVGGVMLAVGVGVVKRPAWWGVPGSEWERWFGPRGPGGGVPAEVPEAAVG